MDSIAIPEQITVYALVKQTGMMLYYTGIGNPNIGIGFFLSQIEAEHYRTMEALKDQTSMLHIFPMTVPNPAYTAHN